MPISLQNIIQYGASRAETAGYLITGSACDLVRVDGYCTGTAGTNCWLMFFDKVTAPSANEVPKKALFINQANGYSYTFLKTDDVSFVNGVYIALSSSEVNYVALGGTVKVSGDVTVQDYSILDGTTKVGPTDVTGIGSMEVWNAVAGRKKLIQVDFVNSAPAATKLWLGVIAANASTNAYGGMEFLPLFTTSNGDGTGTVTNISSGSFKFGKDGIDVYLLMAPTGSTVKQDCVGCIVAFVNALNPASPGVNNPANLTFDNTSTLNITAYYK